MSDNVTLNPGADGAVIATDDNAGVHHQYVKVEWGGDGTFTPVTADNALPVQPGTGASWTVDLGENNDVTLATLPDTAAGDLAAMVVDLAAIEVLLGTIDGDTSTLAGIDFATGTDVASLAVVGGGVEATALRVTLANDSTGVVTVDDGGGSLTVDGTFWQATQPVSLATVPSHEVTNAGTFAVQVTSAPSTVVTATDLDVRDLTATDVVTVTGGLGQTADVKVTLDSESVAVTGTFWQATQPVSVATVPSHEVTIAAAQTIAVTNAGTFAVQAVCTNAGTFATQATLAAETTKVIGTVNISAAQTIAAVTTITNAVTVDLGENNDVTVTSGTITAELSATDNAVLDDIATKLGTIDADTSALAAAVSTEFQCDIVGSLPAGTNAIGKLAANSGVDIGDVDVTSLPATPAGTNLIGKVSAGLDGTNLYDGTTALTLKRATGIATASGANTMVAAVESKTLRILALALFATSTTAVSAYVYNGDYNLLGDGTNKLQLDADGGGGPAGFVMPFNPGGWCQTDTANEALAINLSGATPVIWAVTYCEVA